MTEHLLPDPNETPEDVASLYSWANLHGGKYRDFSASRALMREKARQRMEQAIEDERLRANQEVDIQRAAEAARGAEEQRRIDLATQQAAHLAAQEAAEREAQEAAQRAAEQAAQERARQAAQIAAEQAAALQLAQERARQAAQLAAEQAQKQAAAQAAERVAQEAAQRAAEQSAQERARQAAQLAAEQAARQAAELAQAAQLAARQAQASEWAALQARAAQQIQPQSQWQQPPQERYPSTPAFRQPASPAAPEQPAVPAASPLEEPHSNPRAPWLPAESPDAAGRPAWLTPERPESRPEAFAQPAIPPAPQDDTLQGPRDRPASRWFALRSIFEDNVPAQSVPAPTVARAPVLAIFSLAGGVGKTSLVATLGRVLSSRGERVLLIDTAAYGLLPFFFGARDQRPGQLRTFSPPIAGGDAPIQMLTLDPETLGPEAVAGESLTQEVQKHARGASRVIVDLATASGATTRRIMRMAPQVLVPLMPDMCSVVSVSSIDAFFDHNGNTGKSTLPHYVLNQFDPSLPLHLDVREVLREQLGDRLLPFALRHAPAVSEALAEGMTVVDYAPNSAVTEDYSNLAGWVKNLSAPASTSFRGVRWSER